MSRKASSSLFAALAAGASVGLLLPALVIGGLWIGLREPQQVRQAQQGKLESHLEVLASSLPELLWSLDHVSAREVVAAVMTSPEVVQVRVSDAAQDKLFLEMSFPERRRGQPSVAARDVYRGGARIGRIQIELDDQLASAALSRQRWLYGLTVGGQLFISLQLILVLLNSRLLQPLRELGRFAKNLADGSFDALLPPRRHRDEIGRLGEDLEHMRDALLQQFDAQRDLIARLRGVAGAVPGVVYQLRMSPQQAFSFAYVSDAVRDYLLLEPEALHGSADSWLAQIHAEDRETVRNSLLVSARQLTPWQQEFRIQPAAASGERWLYGNAIPQAEPDGTVLWHGFLTDISSQRRDMLELARYRHHLEELVEARTAELAQATQAAQAASLAKSAFLANISHEIRTPMNAIIGLTYLVQRDSTEPVQQERLKKVADAAEHLLSVINNVLDLSKIEAGKLQLEHQPFQLGPVLESIVGILAPRAAEKRLRLDLDVDPALAQRTFLGDAQHIAEVLLNLAGNAVKFTEQGFVRLSIQAQPQGHHSLLLRFEVQDSGIGIPPEAQARLFRDFEQADSSTTRRYGGSGLGLAICRRLVQLMGGEVGMMSHASGGSRFWFSLPLEISAQALANSPSSLGKPSHGPAAQQLQQRYAGARVLLAEDNAVNQEVAVALLSSAGLAVDVAENGSQALALTQERDYALVLMDVQMPMMDGLEATRAIRATPRGRQLPILAMTANAFADERQRCLDAGMNDHVAKPVAAEQLFQTLQLWLDRQHREQALSGSA